MKSGYESATTSASGTAQGNTVRGGELRLQASQSPQGWLLASLDFLDMALAYLDSASFALIQAERLLAQSSTSGATTPSTGERQGPQSTRKRARPRAKR